MAPSDPYQAFSEVGWVRPDPSPQGTHRPIFLGGRFSGEKMTPNFGSLGTSPPGEEEARTK